MDTLFKITDSGIVFVPRFIKQYSDMEYGSVITHENYNEKLNLNEEQGDYNTEILRILFTDPDAAKVPHIKYLDRIIETQVTRLDTDLADKQNQIEDNKTSIEENVLNISNLSEQINNIINGVIQVEHAVSADKITGIDDAGANRYYGTNRTGSIGFHEMPDSLYAIDFDSDSVDIDGIYFTPRPDSITESMLIETLRNKINRMAISEYDLLTGRPTLNNVLLTGNVSLEQAGIQPAGNYLTEVPSDYVNETRLSEVINDYLPRSEASATYATTDALSHNTNIINGLATVVEENKTYAENRYTRVCIGTFEGTPKTGDILITL